MALFEGRCGPSVDDGLPEVFKNAGEDEEWNLYKRYDEDASFRKTIGPNITLWAEYGDPTTLCGLQIDLDFGTFGNVRGICNYIEDSKEELKIEWRIGPDFNEKTSFVSKHDYCGGDEYHTLENTLALYIQDKDKSKYEWSEYVKPMEKTALNFLQRVRAAPEGTKFVNWKQPPYTEEDSSEFEKIIDEDKWYITMAKLNDPRMAHMYGGGEYPTLAVLTLYLICIQFHGEASLPIMVTKEKEEVFKLSDTMCRQVTGTRGPYTGYGNLTAFERITAKILKDYPPTEARTNYNIWKEGYTHAQALMLVLSSKFEEAMWDYNMVDDPIRVEELEGNFLRVFGSYAIRSCSIGRG